MKQPTLEEITQKLKDILDNKTSREEVGSWACNYIRNDEEIEMEDVKAWHYLVEVSMVDLCLMSNEYMFSEEDLKGILSKYDS